MAYRIQQVILCWIFLISIANLAKIFITSLRTIRYYEEKGLVEESVRIKVQRY
ncbi:MerR family transcriptional regulator [Enterococcus faecalis]|nr:MerR family transcriptional regulator [Enterococcus faecalis]